MQMKKVLFINGQREEIADIFCDRAPDGFDVSWRPCSLSYNEKTGMIKDVEFLVLHPAVVSQSV